MESITIQLRDPSKKAILIALLRELPFVSLPSVNNTLPPDDVAQLTGESLPAWTGHELQLKKSCEFASVVTEQNKAQPSFRDIAGCLTDETKEVSLDELLQAAK